jgi:hypothetical protein
MPRRTITERPSERDVLAHDGDRLSGLFRNVLVALRSAYDRQDTEVAEHLLTVLDSMEKDCPDFLGRFTADLGLKPGFMDGAAKPKRSRARGVHQADGG